jgi:hypothetical protein
MSAQRQDHLQPARSAVVGHIENASHHDCHGCIPFSICFISDSALLAAESRSQER